MLKIITAGVFALTLSASAFAMKHEMNAEQISLATGAAQAAGIVETLTSGGPVTVFVPTNEALEAVPVDKLEAIRGDLDTLKKVISYYAVSGAVSAEQAMEMTKDGAASVKSLGGNELKLEQKDGKLMLTGALGTATVVGTDMKLDNVTVHFIDGALLPEGVSVD